MCGECNCRDGVSPIPRWEIKGYIEPSAVCPRRRVTDEDYRWIELFKHYRDGHLWVEGGVSAQPSIYLDAMRTIELGMRIAND